MRKEMSSEKYRVYNLPQLSPGRKKKVSWSFILESLMISMCQLLGKDANLPV